MTGKRDFVCQTDCCESFAHSEWQNIIKALLLHLSQYLLKSVGLSSDVTGYAELVHVTPTHH